MAKSFKEIVTENQAWITEVYNAGVHQIPICVDCKYRKNNFWEFPCNECLEDDCKKEVE
jgi:hypothetical protein